MSELDMRATLQKLASLRYYPFQALDPRNQSLDQRRQISAGDLIELGAGRQYRFQPRDIRFHEPRE